MSIDTDICKDVAQTLFKAEYNTSPNVTYVFTIFDVSHLPQCIRCKYHLQYNGGTHYCAKKKPDSVFEANRADLPPHPILLPAQKHVFHRVSP